MKPLRMAVVGTGALGRHHARILSAFEGVTLVAVAEINPVAGQAVAHKCGTAWVADHRDLLDCVDAAVIAVPTFAHLDVATDFLERGIPLLVEKPVAADAAQARQMAELAEQQSALLQVGHVERFNPALTAAWPLVGEPKYIRAERFSPYAFRSTDISVVHDVMIHDLDLVLALVDAPVLQVQAFGVSLLGGHVDCVQTRITFANGCIADLTANRVSPAQRRHMQIWSASGCTDIDFAAREVVHYAVGDALKYGTPPLERARQPGADIEQLKAEVFGTFIKVHKPPVVARDSLTEELLAFVGCVRSGARPLVDGREALRAMVVAEDILSCVAAHQWDGHAAGAVGPFPRLVEPRKMAG